MTEFSLSLSRGLRSISVEIRDIVEDVERIGVTIQILLGFLDGFGF